LRALMPDFAALLAMPADAATTSRIERAPNHRPPAGEPGMDRDARAPARRRFGTPQTRPKAASGVGHCAASAAAVNRKE
jgi:hypothetical protein